MSEKIWAEGLYCRRRDNAPDFVVIDLGIDVQRFVKWLERQPVSEKGYLTVNVTRSKDGTKYSAALDTWKPRSEPKDDGAAYRAAKEGRYVPADPDDDLPF